MSVINIKSCNCNDLHSLKKALIDLLFCLEVKEKTTAITSGPKFIGLKKDIYFALRLVSKFQDNELSKENILLLIEYSSNLCNLLYSMVYEPTYFLRKDYNTFIIEFKKGSI